MTSARPHERTFPTRRAYAVIAATLAVFTVYVSLLPFRVQPMPVDAAAAAFWHTLASPFAQRLSRTNFLANVLLFVPLGFALMGTLRIDRPRAPWRALAASVVVVVVCVVISLTAEFLQVFTPRRVPSALDVIAQLLGAVIGIAWWAVTGAPLTRWLRGAFASRGDDRLTHVLTAYAAGWAFVNLAPFDITIDLGQLAERYRSGRIVLVPFGADLTAARLAWDALAAFLSAIPLGLFARQFGRPPRAGRPALAAFALAASMVVALEVAQAFIRSHAADVTDVLFGCAGAALGVWTGARVPRLRVDPQTGEAVPLSGGALLILVLWCGVLAAYHWQPYDFAVDPAAIRDKLARMSLLPFAGYRASDLNALNDVLVKISLSMPFGMAAAYVTRGLRSGALTAMWMIAAAAVFGLLEAGQFLLPTRVPDPGDVLLGVAGAALGLALGRWLGSARTV
jgi:VanZ family protein